MLINGMKEQDGFKIILCGSRDGCPEMERLSLDLMQAAKNNGV